MMPHKYFVLTASPDSNTNSKINNPVICIYNNLHIISTVTFTCIEKQFKNDAFRSQQNWLQTTIRGNKDNKSQMQIIATSLQVAWFLRYEGLNLVGAKGNFRYI